MIQIFYRLFVLYATIHLIWFIIREKKFWNQLGGMIVLIMLLLRLLLIK